MLWYRVTHSFKKKILNKFFVTELSLYQDLFHSSLTQQLVVTQTMEKSCRTLIVLIYSSSVRTSSWLRMRGRACSEKVFSLMIFRRSDAVRKIGRNKEMSRRISLLMSIRTNVGFHWIIRFWKIMESSWPVNEITSHYKDAIFTEEQIKSRHDF